MSTTDVVVATTSFSVGPRFVHEGETFRAGHPVVQGREECFKPFVVDNEIEQATAAPGEKRSKRPRKTAAPGEKPEPTPEPAKVEETEDGKSEKPE